MLEEQDFIEDHEPFDCLDCGGPVEGGHFDTRTFTRGDEVAIVQGVPVSECRQCGRLYLDADVAEYLEEMVRQHLNTPGTQLWKGIYGGPTWTWEQRMHGSEREKRG